MSLLLCPTLSRGDIYQKTGEDGVLHFTNMDMAAPGGGYSLYLKEAPRFRPPARLPQGSGKSPEWVLDYAERCAMNHELPPALVKAVIRAESNGYRLAVSRKGAQGMMQLMPFTSRRFRVKDPFDPVENIEGGVKFIRELLVTFNGDVRLAVAAYNAGPGAVRKYGGVPPYPETREYVRRVMDLYATYTINE